MIGSAAQRNVLVAADLVQTSHPREAAILGGIVRSKIDMGRIDAGFVSRYTNEIIRTFNLVNVDDRAPCSAEIAMVTSRFEECYGRIRAS